MCWTSLSRGRASSSPVAQVCRPSFLVLGDLARGTGTGKSVLLQAIVAYFREAYSDEPDVVAVTSTTGISGVNIGGSTIHSWAGIQLGKDKKEYLAEKIGKSRFYRGRWLATRILIIDESSSVRLYGYNNTDCAIQFL